MAIRWAYLKRVLAGAIFGLYMGHLLYFLNPQVDINPLRLATVTLVYGLTCGLLFGTALWLLRLLRVKLFGRSPDGPYRAHGFGFVVLAAFISSAIYWIHLYAVRIYLPIDAVRLLGKSTNLITAVAFLLLLLWVMERNADRRTSRAIFVSGVVVIAVSSFFLYQRRESYHTEKRLAVVANVGRVAGQRPVVVVAVRNLPYDWIITLAGEGKLPFFEQARKGAYFTRLEPFRTSSPKSLWASLATGKLPYRHGVTGRFSYRTLFNGPDPHERFLLLPSGVGFAAWGLIPPVQRISAQLPAGDALPLWTLFERLLFHASVVNWPSSTGTSASVVVTDRAVHETPHDPTLTGAAAARFNATGLARKQIVQGLSDDLAAAALARTSLAQHHELDVLALEGFSDAQRALHVYRNDLPPRSSVKGEALRAYAEELDRVLAALARDYPDRLLVIVSPSGPAAPELPDTAYFLAREALAAEDSGADDGFVLITGAGAAHKENPASAYVVDVVPTVLFGAGLPVGRDMDGRVLSDAFQEDFLVRSPLSIIQTYEAGQVVVRRGS